MKAGITDLADAGQKLADAFGAVGDLFEAVNGLANANGPTGLDVVSAIQQSLTGGFDLSSLGLAFPPGIAIPGASPTVDLQPLTDTVETISDGVTAFTDVISAFGELGEVIEGISGKSASRSKTKLSFGGDDGPTSRITQIADLGQKLSAVIESGSKFSDVLGGITGMPGLSPAAPGTPSIQTAMAGILAAQDPAEMIIALGVQGAAPFMGGGLSLSDGLSGVSDAFGAVSDFTESVKGLSEAIEGLHKGKSKGLDLDFGLDFGRPFGKS